MTLLKTGFLNALAVGIRVLSSLILNKIIAVYVGPAGYAIIGQFQNLVTMLTTFASGGMNTGVTKGTAEHFKDVEQQQRLWRTAGTVTILGASVAGLGIIIFSRVLARSVLENAALSGVFIWLGLSLAPIALNGLLLAIFNGKKEILRFVGINITGNVIGLLMTGGLTIIFGIKGALIALSVNQAIVFLVSLAVCLRRPWFNARMLFGSIDQRCLRELLKFTAMALVSAAVVPGTQILIRNYLIGHIGLVEAGYWEALSRISGLYMTVVTVPLSIYYLPRFAEIRRYKDLCHELVAGYRVIIPAMLIVAGAIYGLRDIIIHLLFTKDFEPMRDLFAWQVVGDVLKVIGWLLGYVLLAKGMAKWFIVAEIAHGAIWYGLVIVITGVFGLVGAQVAYAASYMLYVLFLAVLFVAQLKNWYGDEDTASG